jgi:glycosyltransferase involved in cell wall biosynthesis
MMIRASVCIGTRNKATYLARTLASIRAQRVPFSYEILVADDGSTDATGKVCDEYDAIRLYLPNPRYRNPGFARNAAYRAARGEVIIAQSDDVMHRSPDTVQKLVELLKPGEMVFATVLNMKQVTGDGNWIRCDTPFHVYSGPERGKPFFFLGSLWRSDVYAIGGNDEQFVEPCWDDNWFADMLIKGKGIVPQYHPYPIGWHQSHEFPESSHDCEHKSRDLYKRKVADAELKHRWENIGGPWTLYPETGNIPKRISFFWGGPRLSWLRYLTLASFRRWNPDWEIRLFRPPACNPPVWKSYEQEDSSVGPNYLERLGEIDVEVLEWKLPFEGLTATHASDLFQWEILARDGGFYSDMDILYVRPMKLYDDVRTLDAVFCLSRGYMTIGFLGSTPGCQVFGDIAAEAFRGFDAKRYQSAGAETIYGVCGFGDEWGGVASVGCQSLQRLRVKYSSLRVGELPSRTVYPFDWREVGRIFSECHPVPAMAVGIHWFGANPDSQTWNARLTEAAWRDYHNTFTEALKGIL